MGNGSCDITNRASLGSDMIHSRLPTPLLQLAPVLAGFLLGVGALSWLAVAGRMWGADFTLAESLVSAEKGWEDRLLVPVEKGWWDAALAAADQVEASAALPSLPRPPPCCLILYISASSPNSHCRPSPGPRHRPGDGALSRA